MSGYEGLNRLLSSEAQPHPAFPLETIPAEQFEEALNPVPLAAENFNPGDLPGMNDFLTMEAPIDMSSPMGADQLSLQVYLLTMALASALFRLDALETNLPGQTDD